MYFPKLCIQGEGGCEDLPPYFTGEFCKASKILDPQENIDLDINQGTSFFIPFMFSSGHIKGYDRKIEHFNYRNRATISRAHKSNENLLPKLCGHYSREAINQKVIF